MNIFHFSDSHLGLTLDTTSREEDFYANFITIIDAILTSKPDVVIHSGDLFHTSKPSTKAISVAVEQFLRLEKAHIPTILLAGNHDTPRLSTTTHPFEIFESFERFYIWYTPDIHQVQIGESNFVGLPHIHDETLFKELLSKAGEYKQSDISNIFISHFGISAREYDEYTDEISGVSITMTELEVLKSFDYTALGHYHKQFCIGNICYPGSGEHTSFNQRNYKIGYNTYNTKTQKITHSQLQTRPMIDFGEIDCKDIHTPEHLVEYLGEHIDTKNIDGSIGKIIFLNIKTKLLLSWNQKLLDQFFVQAMYMEYKKILAPEIQSSHGEITESDNIIMDNFESFFDTYAKDHNITDEKLKDEIFQLLKQI